MKDVRGRIVAQLASEAYATGKDWSLVCGPIKTKSTDNRAYIAKNTVDGSFAVCLRGATTQFLSRKEDIPTGQTTFPNGNCISATVGAEFYSALYAMITATDPASGLAIKGFFGVQHSHNSYLYFLGAQQILQDPTGNSSMTSTSINPPYVTTPNLTSSNITTS